MYLSRIEIDVNNRFKMKDLRHLGCYHGWVEDCFEENKENRSRKLWRIDKINNKNYLLLLSEIKPNEKALERYGVEGTVEIKDYDSFVETLSNGQKLKFKIELNTVKAKPREEGKKRGSIRALKTNELESNFLKTAINNGFKVCNSIYIADICKKKLKKETPDNRMNLDLDSATFAGILEVNDIEKFKKALIYGIGRKKAYGFGLLSVCK